MNLILVHKLLKAADNEPSGFLKVRGPHLAREVELMAAAGLVETAGIVHGPEPFVVINRVTDSGHSFLRAFKDEPRLPGHQQHDFPHGQSWN